MARMEVSPIMTTVKIKILSLYLLIRFYRFWQVRILFFVLFFFKIVIFKAVKPNHVSLSDKINFVQQEITFLERQVLQHDQRDRCGSCSNVFCKKHLRTRHLYWPDFFSPVSQMLRHSLPSWTRRSLSISSHQTSAGDEEFHFVGVISSVLC